MDTPRAQVAVKQWTAFEDLNAVLDQCLALLGGLERMISPGQSVVIKPNITADAPSSSGGTTHMELVEALVERVKACQPGSLIVAEGTGRFGATLETAFLNGGWREMAERQGVPLYNLDAGPHREMQVEDGRYPDAMPFSELVLDADVFITVPCLKTHLSADYTVALKNSFSLTSQRKRSEIHREYRIEESLVDINRIRKPDLTVVDGWDGAEGIAGGTHFERPAKARLLIVGQDPVAVDTVCKQIMGFAPTTRYLKWATEDGVGIGDPERIDVLGDPMSACQRRFVTPSEELVETMPGLTLYDLNACSGCRVAATSAARRFSEQKLLKPITLVYGCEGEPGEPAEDGFTLRPQCSQREVSRSGRYVRGGFFRIKVNPIGKDFSSSFSHGDTMVHKRLCG